MKTKLATEGHYFTQKADVPIDERIFSKSIYAPDNVDLDAEYKEIDDAAYNAFQSELEAKFKSESEVSNG